MPLPPPPPILTIIPNGPDVPDDITFVGHRVDLNHVLDRYLKGKSVEQIAQDLDTLGLSTIQLAIEYYEQYPAEIDAWLDEVHRYLDHERQEYERQHPEIAARRQRMMEAYQQYHRS